MTRLSSPQRVGLKVADKANLVLMAFLRGQRGSFVNRAPTDVHLPAFARM